MLTRRWLSIKTNVSFASDFDGMDMRVARKNLHKFRFKKRASADTKLWVPQTLSQKRNIFSSFAALLREEGENFSGHLLNFLCVHKLGYRAVIPESFYDEHYTRKPEQKFHEVSRSVRKFPKMGWNLSCTEATLKLHTIPKLCSLCSDETGMSGRFSWIWSFEYERWQ